MTLFLMGLMASIALMSFVWIFSVPLRDASLVDRFWGLGFVVVALVWWSLSGYPGTAWVVLIPVILWGLRLSAHIAWRNWGHGEDARYTAMREDRTDQAFAIRSLFTIFWLQGALVALIALPMLASVQGGVPVWPLVGLGWAVWLFGFLYETVADWQLARFKADPVNRGLVMDRGLWRFSRHPNYFGEIVLWLGYGLIGIAFGGWWALPSVALMIFLILRVSGVTLLDRRMSETRPGYREYAERTNALIPGPPRR
jgi:steroid 5-alpha reductase family enzyme